MATRPNAANLSVSQGKGLDDDAARLGAVLEAIELALAEAPILDAFPATRADLVGAGRRVADLDRYTRIGRVLDGDRRIRWVEGLDLIAGDPVCVPEEMVMLRDEAGTVFQQTSDGFGAGACLLEAASHGLCELVERDALGLWSFRPARAILARECDPDRLDDEVLRGVIGRGTGAGLRLRLFDITNDLGIPACLATVAGRRPPARGWRHLDLASGTGAHPDFRQAARQAVLEAVQSRMTTIAGARDDLAPDDYERPLGPGLGVYVEDRAEPADHRPAALQHPCDGDGPAVLDTVLASLRAAGIGSAVLVPLTDETLGLSVGRVFVPQLEQHPRSRNRRLGRRALAALMGRM